MRNGEFDEAFRIHQESLWLITQKLAKVTLMVAVMVMTISMMLMMLMVMFRIHQVTLMVVVMAP